MSTRRPTKRGGGLCGFCGRELARAGMSRHLGACRQRPRGDVPLVLLSVSGKDRFGFWLNLLAPRQSTLADTDALLRAVWLACCAHLSAFEIDGVRYDSDERAPGRSMDVPLAFALPPGTTFDYEYDFGSTTALQGRSLAVVSGPPMPDGPRVVARNLPRAIPCSECGAAATRIDTAGFGFLCAACFDEFVYDDECALPVVNSPRLGMCGYQGGHS